LSLVLVRNFSEPHSGLLFGAEAWCRGERKGKEFLTGDGRYVVMNAYQINIGGLFDDLPEPLAAGGDHVRTNLLEKRPAIAIFLTIMLGYCCRLAG